MSARCHLRLADAPPARTPGIYVYALPHYLRFPAQPCFGQTYFKVGRSDADVIERFSGQLSITSLPEIPVLLRVYETGNASTSAIESAFHIELRRLGSRRPRVAPAGREWFLTTLETLDEIATSFQLPIRVMRTVEDVQHELDRLDAVDVEDAADTTSQRCSGCLSIIRQPRTGRRRRWCSDVCKSRAWRARKVSEELESEEAAS